jgi:hypothetical protein
MHSVQKRGNKNMTTPAEICREEFTQEQLKKLADKASWNALFPIALEMDFEIRTLAALNYNYIELRDLMRHVWREKVASLVQCRAGYKKVRKENDKQRQILMDYHFKEKNQ